MWCEMKTEETVKTILFHKLHKSINVIKLYRNKYPQTQEHVKLGKSE